MKQVTTKHITKKAKIDKHINSGENTHHQDQLIIAHSFNTENIKLSNAPNIKLSNAPQPVIVLQSSICMLFFLGHTHYRVLF